MSTHNCALWQQARLFKSPFQLQRQSISAPLQTDQYLTSRSVGAASLCPLRTERQKVFRRNAGQSGASLETAEAESSTDAAELEADAASERTAGTSLKRAREEISMDTRSIERYNAEILKGEGFSRRNAISRGIMARRRGHFSKTQRRGSGGVGGGGMGN